MKDKPKRSTGRPIVFVVVLILIAAVIFALLPFDTTREFDESEYSYDLNTFIEMDNIPIFSQETNYTCFAVSQVIARNYLVSPIAESEFIEEFGLRDRTSGMLPNEWKTLANQAFNPYGYSVAQLNPKSEAEILNIITESLLNNLPVVFYYSAVDDWNKPGFNTHYSVIFGIDMSSGTIKISNPYGYLEDLLFAEFFDGLVFRSYESEPLTHLMGRKTGYIKSNNIFVFTRV